eukprot:6459147-Amphidinium_carterae.1
MSPSASQYGAQETGPAQLKEKVLRAYAAYHETGKYTEQWGVKIYENGMLASIVDENGKELSIAPELRLLFEQLADPDVFEQAYPYKRTPDTGIEGLASSFGVAQA